MSEDIQQGSKKDYCLPMHTVEHILNQTMVRKYACSRSVNAHIEKKKSKCDYLLQRAPTSEEIVEIEDQVNRIIDSDLKISVRYVPIEEAGNVADLSRLPEDQKCENVRLVFIGDYDVCACIGPHVESTKEIGRFKILNHEFENGRWRMRFKLV